jgi:erythronate-4-phosphate dehydrogenase
VAGYSLEGKLAATRMVLAAMCTTLGLPALAVPAPEPAAWTRIDEHSRDPLTALARVLLRTCDLVADDRSLRALCATPLDQRAAAFERLRSGHALRREPAAWSVHVQASQPVPGTTIGPGLALRRLGFTTV